MDIKLTSFNLRYDKPDPGQCDWRVRRTAVAALIDNYAPDLIGTQEGQAHQLLDLHRLLPDYQSVGGDRTGTGSGEHCAIFYRTQRLKCLETGDFFLSDTPEIPGSITAEWGNPLPRMVTWAVFAVAGCTQTVTLFNTHLDYHSSKARDLSVELLRDRLAQPSVPSSYCFVTADFNAAPGTPPRDNLSQPLPNGIDLNDAFAGVTLDEQMSFHDFTGTAFEAIDTIYYDSRLRLKTVHLDRQQWQGVWMSDHYPVIASFASDEA